MVRIGHGYDAHKLVEGRSLVLCGVTVPYERGLLGHSDADAAVHALIDALLGAIALGDIGTLFPPADPKYKDAYSIDLLHGVFDTIKSAGYVLGNADITIIAQEPKLAPYITQMRETVAAALETTPASVSVKATTEERMGYTGSGEGIACHAVVTVIHAE